MPLLHFTCLSLILLPQIPVSFLLSACYSFCPFMHCLNLSAVPTSSSQACLFLLCVSMSLDSIAKSFDTLLNCCLYFIKLHLNLYILKLSLPYYQLYSVFLFCFVLFCYLFGSAKPVFTLNMLIMGYIKDSCRKPK